VSGRYTHHRDYVDRVLGEHGLRVEEITAATLRQERGAGVAGWLVAARRPARA
jgi:predicted TPR repeat methyltransferase